MRNLVVGAAVAAVVAAAVVGLVRPRSDHHERAVVRHGGPQLTNELRAIRSARRASGILVDFPGVPGRRACRIARGGPALRADPAIRGTCDVSAYTLRRGTTLVVFTERWSALAFRGQGAPRTGTLSHTWRIVVDRAGAVRAVKMSGDFPPQFVM
jgi:hypothetical protein